MTTPETQPRQQLSYARLVFFSMGAAVLVLVATSLVIAFASPGPVSGLLIAIGGVVGAVAALGFVSTRMTKRAFADPTGNGTPSKQ